MTKHPTAGLVEHQRAFIKLIEENSRRYRKHEVFLDFCEMSALSISNAIDISERESREARYMQIVARYERAEIERFPIMLAQVVEWLSAGFHDCLGQLIMSLELGDHWKGQFFTPYPVCRMMVEITFTGAAEVAQQNGFITAHEPASGAGAMVIAMAETMLEAGKNYQQNMHVVAHDLDETAVHMTYIQLSLLHIPAAILHGNSLMVENRSTWWTPAHVLGGWDFKLQARDRSADEHLVQPTQAVIAVDPVADIQLAPQHLRKQLDLFA